MNNNKQIKVLNCLLDDIISGEVSKYDYQINDLLFLEFNNSVQKLVSSEKDYIYVAFLDQKVVGICILDTQTVIRYICVNEDYRNRGVATALLNCCLAYNDKIYIYIDKNETEIRKIFTKIGFQFVEEIDRKQKYIYVQKTQM